MEGREGEAGSTTGALLNGVNQKGRGREAEMGGGGGQYD